MIRILQVVGGLNRAGVETWLMHVLRNIDRDRFRMDFLVHGQEKYAYEDEATKLGSRVIRCLHPNRPWSYFRNFGRILSEHGPYDVVHSHVHHFSGIAMRLAHRAHVPVRIAHSHVDTRIVDSKSQLPRGAYLGLMGSWIEAHATLGLCASDMAKESLFPHGKDFAFPISTVYYSVDLTPFALDIDREQVKRELNIPSDAVVFGHVGRFEHQKNHIFFSEIASEILKIEPRAWFLMIGDGELRQSVTRRFEALRVGHRTSFIGVSNSVPRLMLGAMDVLVFPSIYEGLPVVLIEIQAAGLACVISANISPEGDVVPELIQRLSIEDSSSVWARVAVNSALGARSISKSDALQRVEASRFGPLRSVRKVEEVYSRHCT